jgi:hypothetical protein
LTIKQICKYHSRFHFEADGISGIAVGLAGTFRLLGGSIATAIYTSIVNNGFASALPGEVTKEISGLGFPSANLPKLVSAASLNTAAAYKAVPGISAPVIQAAGLAVKKAYVSAFRTTYLAAIGFGAAAIIAAFFTQNIDRGMKNSDRAVRLENETKETKVVDV